MITLTKISSICKSLSYHLRNIKHIRKFLTNALITSRLDYCNAILYGTSANKLKKLQLCLNTAARLVSGTPRREHITPVLRQLHWLPVDKRIKFKILLITYKALTNKAPPYICQRLKSRSETCPRSLRSTSTSTLAVPSSRLKTYGDRAFSVSAPKLWNALPSDIRDETSLALFKQKLKTYLFNTI